MSYEEWVQASKEGELYRLADPPNPNQPCPKALAICYRFAQTPEEGTTEPAAVTSSSEDKPDQIPQTTSVDPNYVPDSQADDGDKFESTDTYNIECWESISPFKGRFLMQIINPQL